MGIFDWFLVPTGVKHLDLTIKDNNTTVEAKAGDVVGITLEWNPSAGYCWQQSDCTAGVIEAVNHKGDPDPKPGSPATVEFVFKITGPGFLQLTYSRPWGETEPPVKLFRVDIK